MDSILNSIKKLLGITEDYTAFDNDITLHINSVFMILNQLGVGPSEGYSIVDKNDTWSDFFGDDPVIEAVKSFMHLKVKLLFDPPLNSSLIESTNRLLNELEWRIQVAVEQNGKE